MLIAGDFAGTQRHVQGEVVSLMTTLRDFAEYAWIVDVVPPVRVPWWGRVWGAVGSLVRG
jgi:hypothetical protein